MAAGLNVCRASQWTGFPSTGFRNTESLFGVITGLLPDGRVNRPICHPSARSAATAAGQSPAAMTTTIDERFMSELYQSADTGSDHRDAPVSPSLRGPSPPVRRG